MHNTFNRNLQIKGTHFKKIHQNLTIGHLIKEKQHFISYHKTLLKP